MSHLQEELETYIAQYPKVRLIRAPERVGLIRARLLGAKYVAAPVITYLDSHCECTQGWLEPLLDRIGKNKVRLFDKSRCESSLKRPTLLLDDIFSDSSSD